MAPSVGAQIGSLMDTLWAFCCARPLRLRAGSTDRLPAPVLLQVGSDMAAGEVVLRSGQHVGAAEVGILATVGATAVK